MVRDLQANGYRIPAFTSYNAASIPFAYPSFSFYAAGLLNDFGVDLLQIFRFYPLVFSLLAIPAFYWLASELLENRRKAVLATYAFALLKPSYYWLIMGGGLTRSPAFTFSILCLAVWARWLRGRSQWGWMWAGFCFGIICGTHLEIAMVTAVTMLLFLLFHQPTVRRAGIFLSSMVIGGVVSAPYWLPVLRQHGFQPFLMALSNGGFDRTTRALNILLPSVSEETNLTLFAVMMLLGLIYLFATKTFFLPVWWVTLVIIDPRSLSRTASGVMALLMAYGIEEVVIRSLATLPATRWTRTIIRFVPALFIFQLLLMSVQISILPQSMSSNLNPAEKAAIEWVQQNTPIEARFLVLPASDSWGEDSLMEWFPTLTARINVVTVQGYEWMPKQEFTWRIADYFGLRKCLQEPWTKCLDDYLQEHSDGFDYVYISSDLRMVENSSGYSADDWVKRGYEVVYPGGEVVVLKSPAQ